MSTYPPPMEREEEQSQLPQPQHQPTGERHYHGVPVPTGFSK